ncbi:hypothetical protein D3C85_1001840 [compost metagenome]
MRIGIFFIYVISIVSGYQLNRMFTGQGHQRFVYPVFIFLVVAHYLQIEIVAKHSLPPNQCFFGLAFAHVQDFVRNLSAQVTR